MRWRATSPSARWQQRGAGRLSPLVPTMTVSPGELWESYNQLLVTAPLATKAVTASVIIGSGDATAQLVERSQQPDGERAPVDVPRALRWAVFGLLLQAPWNHFFYLALDANLPPTPDPWTLTTLAKVVLDQFVQAPVFTAIILCYFALAEGKGLGFAKQQIQTELFDILLKNWSIFVPATIINLAYCPPELRVLFLNCVFFGWVVYLSLFINGNASDSEAPLTTRPDGK